MFVFKNQCSAEVLESGVVRTIKGSIEDLMVVELKWDKGMVGALHTHDHRQCCYILQGVFEAEVNGEKAILRGGDCFYVEANVPHSLLSLEDGGVILDIFTPRREDFLPK